MDSLKKLKKILEYDNVFLTGGGGVGKSYLCNELIKEYRSNLLQVVVLGSTGISAVQVGGQTLHSFFAFGIAPNLAELQRNDKKIGKKLKELKEIISKCSLIVIDEISMVSSDLMDMIKYRLDSAEFKGKLLFVGDFYQLPPVNKEQKNNLFTKSIYAFDSLAWEFYEPKVVVLDQPKRTKNLEFFHILNLLRIGKVDSKVISYLEGLRENYEVWEQEPTVLFGRNKEAEIMNAKKLQDLESELFMFPAIEEIHDKSLNQKRLQGWKKALGASEQLSLKLGAFVLFTANKKGVYYNGERGLIVDINGDEIDIEKDDGSIVSVTRHEYNFTEVLSLGDKIEDVTLASLKQFPLKLAYAITIHKSQGMSLEKMVCNVDNIFEKSQFYVALSRSINPKSLFLYYSHDNFLEHLKRSVKVDEKVVEFYEKSETIHIEKGKL